MICYPRESLMNQNKDLTKVNEGKIRMMQEVARHGVNRDGNVLLMEDFNDKEINQEYLRSHGGSELWRDKFLECVPENVQHQHVTEHTRDRGADTPPTLYLIFTQGNMEKKIKFDAPHRKSYRVVLESDYVVSKDMKRRIREETRPKEKILYG